MLASRYDNRKRPCTGRSMVEKLGQKGGKKPPWGERA